MTESDHANNKRMNNMSNGETMKEEEIRKKGFFEEM